MIGIYIIVNKKNKKCYIGSSTNIVSRFSQHRYKLKKGIHVNRHLQNSYNKYGKNIFSFEILKICSLKLLLYTEQKYIDKLKPQYNILKRVEAPMRGLKRSSKSVRKSVITKNKNGTYKRHSIRMKGNVFALGAKRTKQQISNLHKARYEKVRIPVIQIKPNSTRRNFKSMKEAANSIGVSREAIRKVLDNPKYTCKESKWITGKK